MSIFNGHSDDELKAELRRREEVKAIKNVKMVYANPVGTWRITTEGDCEGRSTKDLGIHKGHLGDILLRLGGAAYYSLRAERISDEILKSLETMEANVSAMSLVAYPDHDDPVKRVAGVQKLLGPNFIVEPGQYYCGVKISRK